MASAIHAQFHVGTVTMHVVIMIGGASLKTTLVRAFFMDVEIQTIFDFGSLIPRQKPSKT
jgi:hypothetical protein